MGATYEAALSRSSSHTCPTDAAGAGAAVAVRRTPSTCPPSPLLDVHTPPPPRLDTRTPPPLRAPRGYARFPLPRP